jgi:hypothetical protein
MLISSQIAAVAMIPDFANSAIKGRSCIVKSGSFRRLVKLFSSKKCNGLVNSILRKVLAAIVVKNLLS